MKTLPKTGSTLRVLLTFAFIFSMLATPGSVAAAQTITIAPTQPVYLVNNGDTAAVGFRMTFTGTPAEGLDRDITLTLTTGAALQVGGAPGNAQNVSTTPVGGNTTIVAGNTTLAQGRGTLSAAAAIGATNIKVSSVTNMFIGQPLIVDVNGVQELVAVTAVGTTGATGTGITVTPALTLAHASGAVFSVVAPVGSTAIRVAALTNFAAGQTVNIDAGANLETATIAEVGVSSAATLSAASIIGDTNIKVSSVTGMVAGNKLWIGAGADMEVAVIASVGTTGATGTGVTLTAGLTKDHVNGAPVTGNMLVFTAGLTKAHFVTNGTATAPAVVGMTPAGATNIKVNNVTGFVVGQTIYVDTGASQETATVAAVGTAGATGTGLDLAAGLVNAHTGAVAVVQTAPAVAAGATNIKVNNVMGFYPGDLLTIDTGANIERRTILAVGTAGAAGTGIDLDTPLTLSHTPSATVSDTRVLQSTAVLGTDYTVASNTVVIPAGSTTGTVVTIPIATLPNANPSVALTINTTLACTTGCDGVTVNNNDPSTVVINAHGFPYLNSSLPIAERVNDLMSRMSLYDKVGQMTQTLMSVLNNGTTTNEASYNNIRVWRLGSILSGGDNVPNPNRPVGWADMIDAFQQRALAMPLQIPIVYGIDMIHGASHIIGPVLFPHDIAMGATHNPELSYQQGVITAEETRTSGPHWTFAPTICAARDIRWGRTYECYSEDPDLVVLMETIIEGMQGPDPLDLSGMRIDTSSKHFAGDGATQNGTNAGTNVMSYAEFERVALAQYVPAVQKYHTGTIMPSYSSPQLDGAATSTKMSAYGPLLTGWLKEQTGFEGFLISDYNAIDSIPVPNPNPLPAPLNNSYAYQAMISFNAGMDMVMAPGNPAWKNFINYVQTLVKTGYMQQSRIDDAVKRILTRKFALGLFEEPFTDRSLQSQVGSDAHKAVARQATAESQVLLKNVDNILPLSKTAKIYVAGSNAHNVINQAGGWSISWQSIPTGDVAAVDVYFTTVREAIQNVVGAGNMTYSATATPAPAAGVYDVGVVVVGEPAYAEGSGDVPSARTNLTTAADATAITNVCGVMPCVILTVAGRPFWLTDAQFNAAKAVVASWIGSSEGDGIADVLFGDKDFTGRLPMTWSRGSSQEPINQGDANYDPRFPYGWGLRTGSSKARLQATRDALAGITGNAHAAAAVAYLDQLLTADVWDASGAATNAGVAFRLLHRAAGELMQTTADTFLQYDGIVSAARDIAQAAVVATGGPSVVTSHLFADANHEVLLDHPTTAIELLARAVPPVPAADAATQTVQYTDRMAPVTVSAGNAASEFPLAASTEWSLDGGAFQAGLPAWMTWTDTGCTADGIWGACTWSLTGVDMTPVPAGTYVVRTTVTDGAQASTVDVTVVVAQEDAQVAYTGDTVKELGKELMLRATVWDSAAGGYAGSNPESAPNATLGDLSKIWIKFALSDCASGAPITDQYAQVADTDVLGDGIGTATASYTATQEASVCMAASIVAGPDGGVNQWYAGAGADAMLTFYVPSGQIATGAGLVGDPNSDQGVFGFTATYMRKGRVRGNLIFTYRGEYNGEPVKLKLRSTALTGLVFGGTVYPISATIQGTATLSIIRLLDETTLYTDSNATFVAKAVDGDTNAPDTFALVVYDKRGVAIKNVPASQVQVGNIIVRP